MTLSTGIYNLRKHLLGLSTHMKEPHSERRRGSWVSPELVSAGEEQQQGFHHASVPVSAAGQTSLEQPPLGGDPTGRLKKPNSAPAISVSTRMLMRRWAIRRMAMKAKWRGKQAKNP